MWPRIVIATVMILALGTLGADLWAVEWKFVPDDYLYIQDAIDAANPDPAVHTTISVNPGTPLVPEVYNENLDFLGKNVTVTARNERGWEHRFEVNNPDPRAAIIDGAGTGSVVKMISGETSTDTLRGFTLRNGLAPNGGGVLCSGSSPA